jgi:hypothetical protein
MVLANERAKQCQGYRWTLHVATFYRASFGFSCKLRYNASFLALILIQYCYENTTRYTY